jgi:hypothetical protein
MWDCKYKIGLDFCRLRRTGCFPGGKYCVLRWKFEFPLRIERDELDGPEGMSCRKSVHVTRKKEKR